MRAGVGQIKMNWDTEKSRLRRRKLAFGRKGDGLFEVRIFTAQSQVLRLFFFPFNRGKYPALLDYQCEGPHTDRGNPTVPG